jgi:histidyl-tRNA synthetase
MDLSLLKGTRDYMPEEQLVRNRITDILRKTFESYGYSPLETPILNQFELLASKYAGGAEILKETYHLTDQGERELGLRYDLTVPFSRVVGFYCGLHNQIPLPFKRYEIGKVFRDGPVRTGRVREFTQCDVDVVGSADITAEVELIAMAGEIFKALDLPIVVRVNHRKVLSAILETCGVPHEQVPGAILAVDKLEKIGWEGVCKELQEKAIGQDILDRLDEIFQISGKPLEVLDQLTNRLQGEWAEQGLGQMRELLDLLPAAGFDGRVKLVPSLARGLEIYTGTVFECFLVDQQKIASSLAAGGRYDNIVGQFLEAQDIAAYPAVGISFGLDVIFEALRQKQASAGAKTVTQVLVVPIGTVKESLEMASRLRAEGLNVEVAAWGKRVKKIFRYANQTGVPFVVTLGEDEIKAGVVSLKDMAKETQVNVPIDEAIRIIKENLGAAV